MSAAEAGPVSVEILDKEYLIACPPAERDDLLEAASYLNTRLREIRDGGKVLGIERIAVMAALNMANDLIKLKSRDHRLTTEVSGRVKHLRERAEKALARGQQLEL